LRICQNCNISSILRNLLQNETLRAELSLAIEKASNLEMEVGSVSSTLSELQMENERLEQELEDNNSSLANQLQEVSLFFFTQESSLTFLCRPQT
jgi:hypothetical protein